jgi:hypothetical protein
MGETPRLQAKPSGGLRYDGPAAINAMKDAGESPLKLLKRHAHGDWGNLHPDDQRANELALRRDLRILSAYVLSTEERVWVITEADRSATTILLPEEY